MPQKQEQRHIYYDNDLNFEAYNLSGIVRKFPNHFHEYYVIGFIRSGNRHMSCKSGEFDLHPGDLILFNPRDNHGCAPISEEILDYQAVNIEPDVMQKAAREITGRDYTPHFTQAVVRQSEAAMSLAALYDGIVRGAPKLEREEAFFFLLEQILQNYAAPFEELDMDKPDDKVAQLCAYMDAHYSENINLDDLSEMACLSKYYLLRFFTKQTGVSPYRYLQTIRIGNAKKLLEQGVPPIEAAFCTGFSDQSHFTNFFKSFIGVTPSQYMKIFAGGNAAGNGEDK